MINALYFLIRFVIVCMMYITPVVEISERFVDDMIATSSDLVIDPDFDSDIEYTLE